MFENLRDHPDELTTYSKCYILVSKTRENSIIIKKLLLDSPHRIVERRHFIYVYELNAVGGLLFSKYESANICENFPSQFLSFVHKNVLKYVRLLCIQLDLCKPKTSASKYLMQAFSALFFYKNSFTKTRNLRILEIYKIPT